jgi:hypothetical protein
VQPPFACTLDPRQYADRSAQLAELAARSLRSREPIDGGERLVFDGDAGTERALTAAIAAEAQCCSFLRMDLRRDGNDALVLDVTAPPQARPIVAALFARTAGSIGPHAHARRPRAPRRRAPG